MLLVFLMAATIGISLYMEIPRVAFESQRQKELMLVDRGEQYKRAIQLFVKKNSRYPGDIKELESFNNQRYLRHRYKDPITGKEEWRLIHVGPGGVFLDSLVNKPRTDPKAAANQNNFITEAAAVGSQLPNQQQSINPGLRRRASEGGAQPTTVLGPDGQPLPASQQSSTTTIPGQQPLPGQQTVPGQQTLPGQQIAGFTGQTAGQTGVPGVPGVPGIPGIPGQTALPGQTTGVPGVGVGTYQVGTPGATGTSGSTGSQSSSFITVAPSIGSTAPYVGGAIASGQQAGSVRLPGMPGPPVNSQTGGVSPTAYSTQSGAQGSPSPFPQPGMTTGGQNEAARMIQQLLTTPRPGGIPTNNSGMQGTTIGGGIAGVASLSEDEGILVYNERTTYNEWEFIYDPTKEKRIANPNAGVIGTSADKLGSTSSSSSSGSSSGSNSIFGGTSGIGGSSGTGGTSSPGSSGTLGQSGIFGRRP
jgi:hypothetical protein